ncbi:MAG TPA: lipase maturation factor family protein [Candidatus Polarisedimenticolia bacterium]|nr:lipase maturation factor family protein [Candidatus Polarisedimenticolia bacterium]
MSGWSPASVLRWLFDPEHGASGRLLPRWIFLRALGLIFYSAFFSLLPQIRGLIGPHGILPAGEYLQALAERFGHAGYWYAPTLLWFSSGAHMLTGICWAGMIASVLLVLNLWPRGMLAICLVCFLSFVSAAQDFSAYQSDGMLLEAGFISLFFAPTGFRPGWGEESRPSRASLFLLVWECFRIYFESGVAKIMGGDPQWRNFTALDEYYQNGPLPTWIGWYMQHLPHWFHAATAMGTLVLELGLAWMMFLPRRLRILCFLIITPWQIGIILSANYTFLNYLVLALGTLLLDDRFVLPWLPRFMKRSYLATKEAKPLNVAAPEDKYRTRLRAQVSALKIAVTAVMLTWIFYATLAQMVWFVKPWPKWTTPVSALEPFRIANRYGLFAMMTRGRYEIEFQGSDDGQTWLVYPFRFKPQDPSKAPGIYAPYQPRFDWNLWFASLSSWRQEPIAVRTEESLLRGDADVLLLFAGNPFPHAPPRQVRAVIWQYWFTTPAEKRSQGIWWRRQQLGLYAPTLERQSDGRIAVLEWPPATEPRE